MYLLLFLAGVVDDDGKIPISQVVLGVYDVSELQLLDRCRLSHDILHVGEVDLVQELLAFVVGALIVKLGPWRRGH